MKKRSIRWQTILALGVAWSVSACGSMQRPLNAIERAVEQNLNSYVEQRAGCKKSWLQTWLPLFFRPQCPVQLNFYHRSDYRVKSMDDDSVGVGFAVVVSDGDAKFCGQDSFKLRTEALFIARQVRPLLLPAQEYRWIDVEYSSCIPNDLHDDRNGCSEKCEKTIRLTVQDTTAWSSAIVRVQQEYHDYSPVQRL